MPTQTQKGTYIIKGRGGQGIFFLAKVIAQALLSSAKENFSFLKECDEGQRNGEIKITFNLPFQPCRKKIRLQKHNMLELRKAVRDLNLSKESVKKALKKIKPEAFKNNLALWLGKIN